MFEWRDVLWMSVWSVYETLLYVEEPALPYCLFVSLYPGSAVRSAVFVLQRYDSGLISLFYR